LKRRPEAARCRPYLACMSSRPRKRAVDNIRRNQTRPWRRKGTSASTRWHRGQRPWSTSRSECSADSGCTPLLARTRSAAGTRTRGHNAHRRGRSRPTWGAIRSGTGRPRAVAEGGRTARRRSSRS
jgi:hypothetical protein